MLKLKILALILIGVVVGLPMGYVARPYMSFDESPTASGVTNPLLTATSGQLNLWVDNYFSPCGQILFLDKPDVRNERASCIRYTKQRVGVDTGVELTEADIVDPRVKARWRERMGGR